LKTDPDSVKIKGTRDGFTVTINGDEPYPSIEKKASDLFKNMRKLALGAKIVVDNSAKEDDNYLVEKLGLFLRERYGVLEVTPAVKKEETRDEPVENSAISEAFSGNEGDIRNDGEIVMNNVMLMAGRVRSGQKIAAEKHLVILGDVNPGAEVMAGGDILILGTLCGTAIAGQDNNPDSIILALDFRPTQVQIGSVMAAGVPESSGKETEYAFIEDGCIVVERYGSSGPFGKLPVLKER
jgi:septum site-determining protein MinC